MSIDSEGIIKRLRVALKPWEQDLVEKKMFGGVCFFYKGKMCIGEIKGRLVARVVSEKMEEALSSPNVTPMDFTGKPMKESVFINAEGIDTDEKLQSFVELGIEHAKTKTEN